MGVNLRDLSDVESAIVRAIPPNSKLLLAVSGGCDSVCLLASVMKLAPYQHYTVEVAHVDHGTRPDSREDALLVSNLCHNLSVSALHNKKLGSAPNGVNLESWWREQRYSFFGEIISSRCLDFIVTAHHRDDLIETVFSRMIMNRETGGPASYNRKNCVIRPFLHLGKESLISRLKEWGILWREDSSNLEQSRTRNWVRHTLLPKIYEEQATTPTSLLEQANRISDDSRFIWELARKEVAQLEQFEIGSRKWSQALKVLILNSEGALRWRIVSMALLPIVGYPLGPRHGARFIDFFRGNGREFQCAGGISLIRSNGTLKKS